MNFNIDFSDRTANAGAKELERKKSQIYSLIADQVLFTTYVHPFDYKIPGIFPGHDSYLPIKYMRMDGSLASDNMVICIARGLDQSSHMKKPIEELRITYAQDCPVDIHRHRVYYEATFFDAVYMDGCATDFSEHDGGCKEILDSVFAYLSKKYNTPILFEEAPLAIAREAQERITRQNAMEYAKALKQTK